MQSIDVTGVVRHHALDRCQRVIRVIGAGVALHET
jgi:hypothetical protein